LENIRSEDCVRRGDKDIVLPESYVYLSKSEFSIWSGSNEDTMSVKLVDLIVSLWWMITQYEHDQSSGLFWNSIIIEYFALYKIKEECFHDFSVDLWTAYDVMQ
jgi:hypothetical protein